MSKHEKRKILYLITHSERGGAQKYVLDLAHYFQSHGDEVFIAAGEDKNGYLFLEAKRLDIPTIFLRHVKQAVNPYHDLASIFELNRLMHELTPDIIHLNSSKIGFTGALAGVLYKLKFKSYGIRSVIYTAHGFVFNEPGKFRSFYGLALEKLSARWKDCIICVSESDRQSALNANIASQKKIITITLGIDSEKTKFLTRREAQKLLGVSGVVVGTIANLYKTKGLKYFLMAAAMICGGSSRTEPTFVVIGEGPERKALEYCIKKIGIKKHFLLIGALQDASRYLKAFDIFVLPSVKEGWPYTIMEALSASLPIVASRVGGISEIITHKKDGLLVEPKKTKDLAHSIIKLLENPKYAKQLGEEGYNLSKHLTIEKMIEETKKIYKRSFENLV